MEMVNYIFFTGYKEDIQPGKPVYFAWKGQFTRGVSWARGTQVAFYPEAARKLFVLDCEEEYFEQDVVQELSVDSLFAGDNGSLASETLPEFVESWRKDTGYPGKWYSGTFTQFQEELKSYSCEQFDAEIHCLCDEDCSKKWLETASPETEVYHSTSPIDNVWLVSKRLEILKELEEVLAVGRKRGVTWHWI